MKLIRIQIIALLTFSFILIACSSVPVTGRKQFNLIPTSTMLQMSFQQYDEFIKSHKLSDNQQQVVLVKKVGNNIKNAVEKFLRQKGMGEELKNYKWEFNLIESEDVNAWAMPGGKIVIYSGILPVTQDENGLAVVMGHEVAHAVAEHGSERMSQALVAQLGGIALSEALSNEPRKTQQLWMAAYGLGAQVGILLPFSRTQESESDHLGLIFMAMAGYNPNGAVDFWQRMGKMGGASPPEFLSTHPATETRIEDIKKEIPEAMEYYNKNTNR